MACRQNIKIKEEKDDPGYSQPKSNQMDVVPKKEPHNDFIEFAIHFEPQTGNQSTVTLPSSGIHGDHKTVTLPSSSIHGNQNTVTLPSSGIHGNPNTVTLPSSGIHGDQKTVTLPSSGIHGNHNTVTLPSSGIHGNPNTVTLPSSGIHGNPNTVTLLPSGIHGNQNIVTLPSSSIHGNQNTVTLPSSGIHGTQISLSSPSSSIHAYQDSKLVAKSEPTRTTPVSYASLEIQEARNVSVRNEPLVVFDNISPVLNSWEGTTNNVGLEAVQSIGGEGYNSPERVLHCLDIPPDDITWLLLEGTASVSQLSPWRNSPSWSTSELPGFGAEQQPFVFSPIPTLHYFINDVTDYVSYEERRWMHYLTACDTRWRDEEEAGEERRDLEDMEVSSSEEEEEDSAVADTVVTQQPESGVEIEDACPVQVNQEHGSFLYTHARSESLDDRSAMTVTSDQWQDKAAFTQKISHLIGCLVPDQEPLTSVVPDPEPFTLTVPDSKPLPLTVPDQEPLTSTVPDPIPAPSHQPDPEPVPSHQPAPEPAPSQVLDPEPAPSQVPDSEPAPSQVPDLVPAPSQVPDRELELLNQADPEPIPPQQPDPHTVASQLPVAKSLFPAESDSEPVPPYEPDSEAMKFKELDQEPVTSGEAYSLDESENAADVGETQSAAESTSLTCTSVSISKSIPPEKCVGQENPKCQVTEVQTIDNNARRTPKSNNCYKQVMKNKKKQPCKRRHDINQIDSSGSPDKRAKVSVNKGLRLSTQKASPPRNAQNKTITTSIKQNAGNNKSLCRENGNTIKQIEENAARSKNVPSEETATKGNGKLCNRTDSETLVAAENKVTFHKSVAASVKQFIQHLNDPSQRAMITSTDEISNSGFVEGNGKRREVLPITEQMPLDNNVSDDKKGTIRRCSVKQEELAEDINQTPLQVRGYREKEQDQEIYNSEIPEMACRALEISAITSQLPSAFETDEKQIRCPICQLSTKEWSALQEHVCTVHLPWYIGLRYISQRQTTLSKLGQKLFQVFGILDDKDSDLHECFKHCLGRLLHGFLQKCATAVNLDSVSELTTYVTKHDLYPHNVSYNDLHSLDAVLVDSHNYYLYSCNEKEEYFSISPPRNRSGLIHWYTLASIISKLPKEYQTNLKVYEKYTYKNLLEQKNKIETDEITETSKVELTLAIVDGNMDKVREILALYPHLLNKALDKTGSTPLHMAIRNCKIDVATFLLLCQALVDKTDALGNTPLLIAAKTNSREAVLLLNCWGAKEQRCDSLDFASVHGHSEIMNILMDAIDRKFWQSIKNEALIPISQSVAENREYCRLCREANHVNNIRMHTIEHHLPWYLSVIQDPNLGKCTQLAMQLGPSIHHISGRKYIHNQAVFKIWGKLVDGFLQKISDKLNFPSIGFLLEYVKRKQLQPHVVGNYLIQKSWSKAFNNYHGASIGYYPTEPASLGDVLHWRTLYNLLLRISFKEREELVMFESYSWTPENPYIPDINGPQRQPNIDAHPYLLSSSYSATGNQQRSVNSGFDQSSDVCTRELPKDCHDELTTAILAMDFTTVSHIIRQYPEIVLQKFGPSNEGIVAHCVSIVDSPVKTADMIRLLLLHGAPIDAIDMNGATALHRALWCRKIGLIVTLIVWGASPSIQIFKACDATAIAKAVGMENLLNKYIRIMERLPGNITYTSILPCQESVNYSEEGSPGQGTVQADFVICVICSIAPANGNLRDHIFKDHLPWYTWLTPNNANLLSGNQNSGLARVISTLMVNHPNWSQENCVRMLIGELLNNLIGFLDMHLPGEVGLALDSSQNWKNSFLKEGKPNDNGQLLLIRTHQEYLMKPHDFIDFEQPNCLSSLLHWKWLAYFVQKLPQGKQTELKYLEEYTISDETLQFMLNQVLSGIGSPMLGF